MIELDKHHIEQFTTNGFVVIDDVLSNTEATAAKAQFEKLFAGKFETGVQPDEWNWRRGIDDPTLTRQICNAWKSDRAIASIVLRADIGRACAQLRHWPGARINQDNVIWKPPAGKSLGFHQDDSYQKWIVPAEMMTCWITLDDTHRDHGTIEYVKGSHLWPVSDPIQQFHAPDNPLADCEAAAALAGVSDIESQIVPIEVRAGSAVLHHGRVWHGSRSNASGQVHRRSVVSHCCSSEARFHDTNISPVYGRYRQQDTLEMNESFFPILWQQDGYRSQWIDPWLDRK